MRKVNKEEFARRFAARREKLGLSQPQLAKAVGMSQQGVNNIEHATVANPRLIVELADALGTTREWLLYGDGPEEVVRKVDPVEEAMTLMKQLGPSRAGIVTQFIKTLLHDAEEGVA